MACCHCFARFTRHEASKSFSEEKSTHEEKTEKAQSYERPVKRPRRFGALLRVEQMLQQHCEDNEERRRLLEHAEDILKDKAVPIIKQWNERLLHDIVSVVPTDNKAKMASEGLIQALLRDGVDVSMVDAAGDTPLLKAVKVGNRVAVENLLDTKCNVNSKDRYGRTCLIYAAHTNDEETVKKLLQKCAGTINVDLSDYSRYTALAYAASFNNIAICRLLLNAGANPNANSVSPLYLAVKNNCSYELIELLVTNGSSVNASFDYTGFNVLTAAAKSGRPEVVTLLLKYDANFNKTWHRNMAFLSALQRDHVDVLRVFIDHGVSIQSDNAKGLNILHESASQGSSSFLSYLVCETDMNLDQRDRNGKTAFYLASQNGHRACMEVLFQANADCCATDRKGQTPLEAALFHNHFDSVAFFIDNLACPSHTLFSTLQMMRDTYDSVALSKISAVVKFQSSLQDRWGELDQVESLTNICIIKIRQILGQKKAAKVAKLPLPSRMQSALLKMTRS